jgi:hypothetical protein
VPRVTTSSRGARSCARLEGWVTKTIAHTAPHPRGAIRPSFAHCLAPPKIEGAGKAGWPLHPGPCAKGICASARTTGTGGDHTGLPCAVVYGLYVISSVNLAVCHRRLREACELRLDLSASLWGARTTRFHRPHRRRTSDGTFASTAFRTTFVTTRNAPLQSERNAES